MKAIFAFGIVLLLTRSAYAVPLQSFSAAAPTSVSFQDGDTNGYSGTVDLFIGNPTSGHAGSNNATRQDLHIGNSSSQGWQILVRFDDILGPGAGQIPQAGDFQFPGQTFSNIGTLINSATLTMQGNAAGRTIDIHQLSIPFVENESWNSLGNGVNDDGIGGITFGTETTTVAPLVSHTGTGSPQVFDVTQAVQNWVDGDSNFGLLLTSLDANFQLRSRDDPDVSDHPLLSVNFTILAPPPLTPEPGTLALCGGAMVLAVGTTWWRRRRVAAGR